MPRDEVGVDTDQFCAGLAVEDIGEGDFLLRRSDLDLDFVILVDQLGRVTVVV